jgi:hypothetical protein
VNIIAQSENQFSQFRLLLYHKLFNKLAGALLALVITIASNLWAKSVAELSLRALFQRQYPSLYKAIAQYQPEAGGLNLAYLAEPYIPPPSQRPFYLLGLDTTSDARPFASKLEDRQFVHQPNPVKSNKPVTIGHQFSELCELPERKSPQSPHWVIPLSDQRVESNKDKEMVGAYQVRLLLEKIERFRQSFCVLVADCAYSKPSFLVAMNALTNLVTIVRARSNRNCYRQPPVTDLPPGKGHPVWFGDQFSLDDPSTWPLPEDQDRFSWANARGKRYEVRIEAWWDLLMRGSSQSQLPMHKHPFTLVQIRLYTEQEKAVYKDPLWLIVMGEQRRQLTLRAIYEAYVQRYDLEHFFRFGKQKLLLDAYQTPETVHEEHWWELVHIAYLLLWVAKPYASKLPRPWERYQPGMKDKEASPTMVQRSLERINGQFGLDLPLPQTRGKSPGRRKGMVQPARKTQPIVCKGHSRR